MPKERNYGIDCLRFVLMFMICILHVLGQGGILSSTIKGTTQYNAFWFVEVFCYCAVDSFSFITGYVAINNKGNNSKLIVMWFQVLFYSLLLSLFIKLLGFGDFGGGYKQIIKLLLPITSNSYWYFTAFFMLTIVKPFLNTVLFSLDRAQLKVGFVTLFVLFSLQGFLGDPYRSLSGNSAIWLIVLYCMGVMAKRGCLFEKYSNWFLVIVYIGSSLFTWISFLITENRLFINYISPTILINGIVLVILFSRTKSNKLVIMFSKYSRLAFGIYLFQLNYMIWNYILKDALAFVANSDIYIGFMQVFGFASLLFISGLIVEILRDTLFRILDVDKLAKIICKELGILISKSTILCQ